MTISAEVRQNLDLVDEILRGSATMEVVVDTGRENGLYEPAVMNGLEALAEVAGEYVSEEGLPLHRHRRPDDHRRPYPNRCSHQPRK